jgi:hypothetical protein
MTTCVLFWILLCWFFFAGWVISNEGIKSWVSQRFYRRNRSEGLLNMGSATCVRFTTGQYMKTHWNIQNKAW